MGKIHKCVWCDRELTHAPTKRFWTEKTYLLGICHICVIRLMRSIIATAQKEVEDKVEEQSP